ncbi:hypothetical protein PHSC3_000300 [Chlamydiales bacterium STE3]|nr:hypothetical protein PHSC3_000300 [Chlamydiales bacterium STE3]
MFELSIACKYLLPRWRQLSVSIISLISIIVISLVVWLVLVFFSVTSGLEKIWVGKLIAVTAPLRVTPTENYYKSYYYQVDAHSAASGYTSKSISEKLAAEKTDPYDPEIDEELPLETSPKDFNPDGSLKDLVKLAVNAINDRTGFKGLQTSDYQMTLANIRVRLIRGLNSYEPANQSFISQSIYLGSLDGTNAHFASSILPITANDLLNSYAMLTVSGNVQEDIPSDYVVLNRESANSKLQSFFRALNLDEQTDLALNKLSTNELEPIVARANRLTYDSSSDASYWLYRLKKETGKKEYHLPFDEEAGEGVVLPKSFREAGVLIGDRGYLSYFAPTTSTVQEQRIPIFIAGFYDPGIVPLGGKYVLASSETISAIRSVYNQEDTTLSNGINIRIDDLGQVDALKKELQDAFTEAGIEKYWKIETYKDFDFAKDLLQQLNSEKNIFSLIAGVIIIVACSNIISMMVILVNDKKLEIGILRSMGATSFSIAAIFGFSGMVMGLLGSLIGALLALITLNNLELLIDLISKMQGFQAFNPLYYGNTLPHEISSEALIFVFTATIITSLLAGLIPAVKASSLKPAAILRS